MNPTFPDVKIAVLNKGPLEPTFCYDGKEQSYPIGRAVVVPLVRAYFDFAVELNASGKLDRHFGANTDRTQSWGDNRLSSFLPYGLKHGREKEQDHARFNQYEEWFKHGVEFAMVETTAEISSAEFGKLKK